MCRTVADIFQAVIAEIFQNCGRDIACIFQRDLSCPALKSAVRSCLVHQFALVMINRALLGVIPKDQRLQATIRIDHCCMGSTFHAAQRNSDVTLASSYFHELQLFSELAGP